MANEQAYRQQNAQQEQAQQAVMLEEELRNRAFQRTLQMKEAELATAQLEFGLNERQVQLGMQLESHKTDQAIKDLDLDLRRQTAPLELEGAQLTLEGKRLQNKLTSAQATGAEQSNRFAAQQHDLDMQTGRLRLMSEQDEAAFRKLARTSGLMGELATATLNQMSLAMTGSAQAEQFRLQASQNEQAGVQSMWTVFGTVDAATGKTSELTPAWESVRKVSGTERAQAASVFAGKIVSAAAAAVAGGAKIEDAAFTGSEEVLWDVVEQELGKKGYKGSALAGAYQAYRKAGDEWVAASGAAKEAAARKVQAAKEELLKYVRFSNGEITVNTAQVHPDKGAATNHWNDYVGSMAKPFETPVEQILTSRQQRQLHEAMRDSFGVSTVELDTRAYLFMYASNHQITPTPQLLAAGQFLSQQIAEEVRAGRQVSPQEVKKRVEELFKGEDSTGDGSR